MSTIERTSDDEAVSIMTGYILNLAVAVIIVTILVFNAQSFLNDVSERTAETELEVTAERIATKITVADGLQESASGSYGEVPLEPRDVISQNIEGYTVNVTDAGPGESGNVTIESDESLTEVEVTVPYNVSSEVEGYVWSEDESPSIVYNGSGVLSIE